MKQGSQNQNTVNMAKAETESENTKIQISPTISKLIRKKEEQNRNGVDTVKAEPEKNTEIQLSPTVSKLIRDGGYRLSPVAIKLVEAVAPELGNPDGFTPRHKLNQISPSFPYNHRTMANRDSLGTGPKDQINVGKHKFYRNLSILEILCKDLSK